jgi:hypothetical protein
MIWNLICGRPLLSVAAAVNVSNMPQQTADGRCPLQLDKEKELMRSKSNSIKHSIMDTVFRNMMPHNVIYQISNNIILIFAIMSTTFFLIFLLSVYETYKKPN